MKNLHGTNFQRRNAMQTFHQVMGLFVVPRIDAAKPPPYVDHDAIDYPALRDLLVDQLHIYKSIRVRVPDDTIDQLTLNFRLADAGAGQSGLEQFGQALLELRHRARTPVRVRNAWMKFHVLQDRTKAPPPTVLAFMMSGSFLPMMEWSVEAGRLLGIRAWTGERTGHGDNEGVLSESLRAGLENLIGVPFETTCGLARVASTQPPF